MASEQKQAIDRRQALGLIGKGSAAALTVGATGTVALASSRKDPLRFDLDQVRREFEGGAESIPLDALLPDDADAAFLQAARGALRFRTRGMTRVVLDRGTATREELIVAKRAMLDAERRLYAVVDRITARQITPAEGRMIARDVYADYLAVLRPLGL